ncbi:DNA-processing protein DprA [Polynucleobacter wuianus]|uniref:DNA-processing protein DprA n=1 Tax=Polynucleobacter wuianus TaxID=1743168 RepID=UPI001C0BEF2B|nr:DNA-processing protein DprA [Polynucleobacter wuianus]
MAMTPNKILIHKIERDDKRYPCRLMDLFDPPDCLYVTGDLGLLKEPMLAIVGARNASAQGLKNAHLFAWYIATAGATVISGLARGIDGSAHRAALGTKASTVAVCGTGLDITYPKEHSPLAHSIRTRGLVISELPPGVGPKAFHFPRRNRIIAALSLGVLVIEAAEKSGSLITARIAAELGREVFALPGPINDPLFAGCHQLIQQGAKLVRNPKDVLEELTFP